MITAESLPWWETIPDGQLTFLAFIKVDRVGSASEWLGLPQDAVTQRAAAYTAGIEQIARDFSAAQPLNWQGDGVMLFLCDASEAAPIRAWQAALEIWNRIFVVLNLSVRIAVHCAKVPWNAKTGQIRHRDLDFCGHLEEASPPNAITITEDVYLVLPDGDQKKLAPLGTTSRDRIRAFVFPEAAAGKKDLTKFEDSPDLGFEFRRYARSPEIRCLRYVGFRLTRKEPPSLDVQDVFISPRVQFLEKTGPIRIPFSFEAKGTSAPPPGWEAMTAPLEREAPEPFEQALRDRRSLVILGEPGAGKTTLLRWLAVVAAGGKWKTGSLLGVEESLLPLPVSVGRLAELCRQMELEVSVIKVLACYFLSRSIGRGAGELEEFLHNCLKRGECLVLLDGLDEVDAPHRLSVVRWLETFADQYPGNRFIVTSRRVGYVPIQLPSGHEALLLPFEPDQVARYVACFTREYSRWETGEPDETKAAGLLAALDRNPRLSAIARNPFMLSALALVHRAEGSLPRHRVMVYELFARALCETWGSVRRLVSGEGRAEIRYEEEALPILGGLALAMHDKYPSGVAPEEFVLTTLAQGAQKRGASAEEARRSARGFLTRSGEEVQILLPRGHQEWGFLHLTFQEFFAAAGLHAQEIFEEEAMKHLFEPRWEEVIRLGVGYMALIQKRQEGTRRFIEKVLNHQMEGENSWITEILKKQIPFAALLTSEAGDALPLEFQNEVAEKFAAWVLEVPEEVSGEILGELSLTEFKGRISQYFLKILADRGLLAGKRGLSARALGALGVKESIPILLETLKGENEDKSVRLASASALGALGAKEAITVLLETFKNKSDEREVRSNSASTLGALGAKEAITILLETLKDKSEELGVRSASTRALGALGAKEAIPVFLETLRDKDEDARIWHALGDALGALGAKEAIPIFLETLKDKDEDARIRHASANALGALGAKEAITILLETLKDKSEDIWVRSASARALGALGAKEAIATLLEILRDRSEVLQVRYASARALGALGAKEAIPIFLETLKDKSEEPSARYASAMLLEEMGAEEAIPTLLDILKDKKEPFVGSASASALGALGAKEAVPALLEFLRPEPPACVYYNATFHSLWRISGRIEVTSSPA